ncbi:hypothetical protein [Arcobacter caeni]|uniref:Uncharacterized protein n=1 Tax=Arcobacter caeni TaxID=1912877 RepID=A0A363D2N4_9BACT|nr:hypothetical protein [Arcobacter caeni]PUE65542.1 hypothetical protein B0174_04255 [Arcobacter caeni]
MIKIISSVVAVGFLIAGCASKQVDTGPKYSIDIIKKNSEYIIKPLQYTSAKLISGIKSLNNDSTPIILGTDNCRILGEAKSVDKYVANTKILKVNCTIDGEEYESRDIKAWLMKDNYVGIDLSKKEVDKRDDQKINETDNKQSLYGLNPGQEVKIFIEEGSLTKI